MILDEIKKANIQAIKDKNANARTIYSVIMNKALLLTVEKRSKGQDLNDVDMVGVLQKTIKELSDEAENYKKAGNSARVKEIEEQSKMAEVFLPQLMSEKEIYDVIAKQTDKSVPNIMKLFKSEYNGKCDMRIVQETLKKFN